MKNIKENYAIIDEDFNCIVEDILENETFQKLKEIKHHGITRYNHLLRVAYHTYKVTKKMRLKYVEATRGALLHDFFFYETEEESTYKALRTHSDYALKNACKHFCLTELEKDIIKTHMFPITKTIPHYKESYIVDLIDDISSCYERTYSIQDKISTIYTFIFVFLLVRIR